MNGELIPSDYAGSGLWQTLAHSQAAVQLHHRLVAYALRRGHRVRGRRDPTRYLPPAAARLAHATATAIVLLQPCSGSSP